MPIDWTKLNTIFKKANKRYPNVPAIDGKTESHTQALHQIKEALDIAQRRSGDIRDSFVRVGELEELGLFDNQYAGKNLGTGKKVYKRTDEATALKYHEFRTLKAGSGITLTQTDTEIEIAAGNGSSTNTEVSFIGDIAHRCGPSSTSFTPNENSSVAEGDLCVWVVCGGEKSVLSSPGLENVVYMTPPAGWSVLQPQMYINASSAFSDACGRMGIFYKFLSAADINTLFTCSENTDRFNTLCSFAMFFRNVDTMVPFGSGAVWNIVEYALPLVFMPLPIFSTGQKIVNVFEHSSPTTLTNSNFPFTANETIESEHRVGPLTIYGGGSRYFHGSVIPVNLADDENWISNETVNESVVLSTGQLWSACFTDKTARTPGTYKTRLTAQAISTEHYVEYEVTLQEGFWYSFYALIQIDFGSNEGAWISVIDGNGAERAMCCAMQGDYYIAERSYLDPYADRNTNWRGQYYGPRPDGVSSEGGGWWWLQFKAKTAGTHKLRIYLQNSNGLYTVAGRTFNTAGVGIDVGHVGFRSGRYAPKFTYTANGAVTAGASRLANQVGWMDDVDINRRGVQFVVNPAWSGGFPYGTMFECGDCTGQSGAVLSSVDGHTTIHKPSNYGYGDDDSDRNGFRAERMIFPTMEGGAAGKYYAEIHYGDTGTDATGGVECASVGVQYLASDVGQGTAENQHGGVAQWYGTQIWDARATAVSTPGRINDNNIIGVAVDYSAGTVTFYRNGTLIYAVNMVNSITTGWTLKEVPLCLYVALGFNGTAVVRLREPFAYTVPTGHVAWDWYGSSNASPYLPGATPTGGGAQIIYIDENGDEKQRTLVGGNSIEITQYQEYITIADTTSISNRGTGHFLYAAKVNYDWQFKSLLAGTGIAISSTDNDVTIHSTSARYLTDLLDVDEAYPNSGDYLKYNGSQWEGVVPALSELSDTVINGGTLSMGQVLTWNGSKWVNSAPTGGGGGGGGGGPIYLNDILDVYCPYPNPGDNLVWTGYDWQCAPGTLDGLADVNVPSPDTGLPLVYNGSEWKSGNVTKVETFTVSGSPHTWNKDPKAKSIEVWCIAGGGGGGAGYLGAVSSNRGSGAGGGSGGISAWTFRAGDVPDSVTITVGSGGTGGVGKTGAAGAPTAAATAGGTTSFGSGAGQLLAATGGGAGASGAASTTPSTGGAAGTAVNVANGVAGGNGDADAAGSVGGSSVNGAGGGGGGAGSGTTNQVLASGAGGASGSLSRNLAGGAAVSTVSNTNGTNGNPGQDSLVLTTGGSGGSGGGCGHSTTAVDRTGGNGGAGGYPSGGGGGGGASTTNGAGTAGNGGRGGDGVCVVISHF